MPEKRVKLSTKEVKSKENQPKINRDVPASTNLDAFIDNNKKRNTKDTATANKEKEKPKMKHKDYIDLDESQENIPEKDREEEAG